LRQRLYKLGELADVVGGVVDGDGATVISGVAGIREAKAGDITFLSNPRYEEFVHTTHASAIIAARGGIKHAIPAILVDDPYLGFVKVLGLFAKQKEILYEKGVHRTALVDPDVEIGQDVSIGPYCQVNRGAKIGPNTRIFLGGYIGEDVTIGNDCLIYPNVTIREGCEIGHRVIIHPGAVVGSDGFGFARNGEVYQKIPQIGKVVIEDDVEIGANSTVDRGTTGVTRVCQGSKIDNLVQIAHNVVVGKNSVLAAQVGISGSVELGEGVVMAGQVGCVGHITIGNRVVAGAQSGITKSIPDDTTVSGYPAREHRIAKKLYGDTTRIPEMRKRIRELEKRIEELQKRMGDGKTTKDDQ